MTKPISLLVQMQFSEYLRLNFSILLRSRLVWTSVLLSFVLLGMLIEEILENQEFAWGWKETAGIGLLVFLFIVLPLLTYLRTKSYFAENKSLAEPTQYQFFQDKIQIDSKDLHVTLFWERVYKVREFSEWFMIYQNRHLAYLVPKKSFATAEDLTTLRNFMQKKKLL
ncbi:YcxB family protein [Hugenholtzia roseola]|uniref:YcxB family protein n=1 Tax=Hugenholtzia roseola TaxID=1002 RepID=UPI0004047C45|nr:YcxB family protein [Hugenholtzia roseola]